MAALNALWELVDETSNVKAYSAGCLADANKRFVPQPRGGQFSYQFLIQLLFFPVSTFSNISERRRPLRDGQDVNKIGLLFFESETARAL